MSGDVPRAQATPIPDEPAPAPPGPPGPATAAALVRAEGIEGLLAGLARDLGVGRDLALARALTFYRKLAKRARRAGASPEAFFQTVLRAFEEAPLRTEIEVLRAKIEVLSAGAIATRGAPAAAARASRGGELSPVELFRQIRGGGRGAAIHGRRGAGGAPEPEALDEASPGPPNIVKLPVPRPPDAQRALQSVAAAANEVGAGPPVPPPAAPPEPPADGKLDYAERRARVPKITF